MNRVKDASGKALNIGIKDALDLMDQVSKSKIMYDEVKMIFNNKVFYSANNIAPTSPTDNKINM